MPISRRHFLRAGGVAMAAASAPISLNVLAAERRPGHAGTAAQAALMNKAMFAAHLHTVFLIRADGGREVPVELIELRDCGPETNAHAGQECFALAFRARQRKTLKQSTYQMEHRTLGRFDLFIAPVRSQKHGQLYEAIINHVRA